MFAKFEALRVQVLDKVLGIGFIKFNAKSTGKVGFEMLFEIGEYESIEDTNEWIFSMIPSLHTEQKGTPKYRILQF